MGAIRTSARAVAWAVAAGVVVLPLVQPGGLLGPDLALASSALTVSGSVSALQPGVPAQLVLTVENADSAPVVIGTLTAVVTNGGTAACPASALRIAPWHGRLDVAARSTASQPLEVLLDPSAQCDELSWQLSYSAEAQ